MFESWGGKRSLLKQAALPMVLVARGRLELARRVTSPIHRIVFVCAGNICRSPFAEHVARSVDMRASSMGLEATDGAPADPQAARAARAWGIHLGSHRARRFQSDQIEAGDLGLAFELWHALALERELVGRGATVRLIGAYLTPMHYHIADPYGLDDRYFARCFERIRRAVLVTARASRRGA